MRVLCILMPHFPYICETLRSPGLKGCPVVVLQPEGAAGPQKLVMDFSPDLEDLQPGMSLQKALSRHGEVRLVQADIPYYRSTFNEILDGLKDDIVQGMKEHGLTGNVRRDKYDMPPQVRMTNTFILPDENGPASLAEMAALIPKNKRGVYVKSCQGGWVNPDGGEFVVNANLCYLIENGTVTDKPIKGVKITGNVAKFVDSIRAIGNSKTIDRTFTGYCGKNDQWVPVEGGGPLLYIEDAKLAGGSNGTESRSWEELVDEYDRQHRQVVEGKRSRDSIYLPEIGEVLGKDCAQSRVCLVTVNMKVDDEIAIVMGERDSARYTSRNGRLVKRGDRFE